MGINKKGLLIVVSGPSGVGKDTICSLYAKKHPNTYISISMTTRSIRGNEINFKDYIFVTKDEFIKNIDNNNFLEYALVYDNYYGTPKDEVINRLNNGIDVILVIDSKGALKVKEIFNDAILIFIMPPNMKELLNRLINRNTDSKDTILKRFRNDYDLVNEYNKYNYVVVNDNLDDAIYKFESIILSEKCKTSRIEDLELEKIEEVIN